jgi:hypothetical protein
MLHTLKALCFIIVLGACIAVLAQQLTEPKGFSVSHLAKGTFEVKVQPLTPPGIDGVTCFSIDKTIHGDLEATTSGKMFTAGDPKAGAAGYVAIESVTGKLAGKSGSFVLQHFATMDANGRQMTVKVTPGSGTGELKGISGTFTIIIADGKHSYDFEYSLPNAE